MGTLWDLSLGFSRKPAAFPLEKQTWPWHCQPLVSYCCCCLIPSDQPVQNQVEACAFSLQDVLDLAFSIVYDVEEYYLNFVAPTRYEVSPAAEGHLSSPTGLGIWLHGPEVSKHCQELPTCP